MKKIRIYINVENGFKPVKDALEKISSLFFNVIKVDAMSEADLIIVTNKHGISSNYSADKWYAIVKMMEDHEDYSDFPSNVKVLSVFSVVEELAKLLDEIKISSKSALIEAEVVEAEMMSAVLGPKVLVIEDTSKHQKSARQLLTDYNVKIAIGYEEGIEALSRDIYEFVLTDLYMPMSSKTLSSKAFKIGQLVDYGILLAIEAARKGAKYVAVATDLDHHSDHMSAAFDHFSGFPVKIENATVMFMHAPMKKMGDEYVKNWKEVIRLLKK